MTCPKAAMACCPTVFSKFFFVFKRSSKRLLLPENSRGQGTSQKTYLDENVLFVTRNGFIHLNATKWCMQHF